MRPLNIQNYQLQNSKKRESLRSWKVSLEPANIACHTTRLSVKEDIDLCLLQPLEPAELGNQ